METRIAAPPERCFDLSRSIDFHIASTGSSGERAVAGVTSGLIGMGEHVTWEARHLGLRMTMSVRVDGWDRPAFFSDSQTDGPFRIFHHRHEFLPDGQGTWMRDILRFSAPYGWAGKIAEPFVAAHLRRFLRQRNEEIRRAAEGEEWRTYLKS